MVHSSHIHALWYGARTLLGNVIFPPSCPVCQRDVEAAISVCHSCFDKLHHITDPACPRCSNPFDYAWEEDTLCADCEHALPPYDQAKAALRYNEISAKLVTQFKYSDATYLTQYIGQMLYRAIAPLYVQADVIVPVPLHPKRLRARKYNQSMLLAKEVATYCDLPVQPHWLARIRHTAPQASLTMTERHANVEDVFAVPDTMMSAVSGKRILLIDDVMTTGATIHACTVALKQAGASWVGVGVCAKRVLEA